MKKILFIFLGMLYSFSAVSAEWTFEKYGNVKVLGGYDNTTDSLHLPATIEAGFLAQYAFNNRNQLGLYLDLIYGADKEIKDYNQGIWGEQIYGVWDSSFGKLIVGQTDNVANQLAVGAPDIEVLGVNKSDIVNFVANPNWQRNNLATAYKTLNSTGINTDGSALKVSYITPDMADFTVGFSYVPDSYSRDGLISKDASYKDNDAYVMAGYYATEIGNYTFSASLGLAEFVDNDKEISFGSSLYYRGFTIGASVRKTFADGDKADRHVFDNYRKAWAFNGGISYEFGPFKSALTYFYSSASHTYQDEIIQFSNSYKYGKNLEFYGTVAHGNFDGLEIEDSNHGYAFVLGAGINF